VPFRSRDVLIVAALAAAAIAWLWFGDRDYARELLRAIFGLSGGTTAGG
jgi:hypothetical protein